MASSVSEYTAFQRAWALHEPLIPNSPLMPIRIRMEVGERNDPITRSQHHDRVLAHAHMAKVLAATGRCNPAILKAP